MINKRHLFGIFLLSGILHFWGLGIPHSVVFDEVHFGKFVNSYCCTHQRHFDIHPPLGKLVIAATGWLAGMDGKFPFENIGQFAQNQPLFWLRFWPAVMGTLLPVMAYLLLILLEVSEISALAGALALALENATIVQTRHILLDGFLMVGIIGTIYSARKSREGSLKWAAAVGAFSAIAIATKFTGLVTLVIPFLFGWSWGEVSKKRASQFFKQLPVYLITLVTLYTLTWLLHYQFNSLPGAGDAFIKPTGQFFNDVVALHKEMYRANATITATHPDATLWWAWPIQKTPTFYWTSDSKFIYLFGNPAIWLGSLALLFPLLFFGLKILRNSIQLPIRPSIQLKDNWNWMALLLLYIAYYAPLIPVKRPLFLYHYLPAVWILSLAAIAWLDKIDWLPKHTALFLGVIGLGFLIALPLTYGLPISRWYLALLYWRPEFGRFF